MTYSPETMAAFSEALGALYSAETPAEALELLLPKLGLLFQSRHIAIDELRNDGTRPIFHGALNLAEFGDVPQRYAEFAHEHPVVPIIRDGGFLPVSRISEFLSHRQFSQTGFYQEIFRSFAARDQLCIAVRLPKSGLAVTIHRETAFTPDEAYLASLLQPHVGEVVRQDRRFMGVRAAAGPSRAWDVPLTSEGGIPEIPDGLARLFARYFPSACDARGWPQEVLRWLRVQKGRFRALGAAAPPLRDWCVARPCGRLLLQVRGAVGRGSLLRVAEEKAMDFFQLRALRLTPRECEVVFWIAEGKRDAEIAAILGVATRTASKHVENVLRKLEAETRLAAVHMTHEWLRRHG